MESSFSSVCIWAGKSTLGVLLQLLSVLPCTGPLPYCLLNPRRQIPKVAHIMHFGNISKIETQFMSQFDKYSS